MEAHKPIKRGNFLIYKNKPLGKGSFACTYLANSVTNPSEQYACKMIDKKQADKQDNAQEREVFKNYFITKVQDEVKTWKELDHPHIVKFYDIIESQNSVYMILEYCEGGNFESCLKSQLTLDPQVALQYAKELLSACTYLYLKGIIHRDIKPANILMKDGHLKISDFGLAKILEKDQLNTFKTGTFAGSPCYMAPEVLRSEKYGRSCDVWSLGIILYRIFLGILPWELTEADRSEIKILNTINTKQIKMNKKLPEILEKLIREMLEQDGRKRIRMPEAFEMIQKVKF